MNAVFSFFLSILTVLLSFFGCNKSVQPTLSENLPVIFPDSSGKYSSISYGSETRQTLDLYLPENPGSELSLIICLHGGGWTAGNKELLENFAAEQTGKGLACLVPNYQYADTRTDCDVILNDISLAMLRAKQIATSLGITLTDAAIGGGSAGGHIALLYAFKCAETSPIPLKFVFSMAGPADLTNKLFITDNYLGDANVCALCTYLTGKLITKCNYESEKSRAALYEVSPIAYVNENTIPVLFTHGKKDTVVPYEMSASLALKLEEYGVTYNFLTLPNSGHEQESDPDVMAEYDKLYNSYISKYLVNAPQYRSNAIGE